MIPYIDLLRHMACSGSLCKFLKGVFMPKRKLKNPVACVTWEIHEAHDER
jgi:hypothetical protein